MLKLLFKLYIIVAVLMFVAGAVGTASIVATSARDVAAIAEVLR